jgi:predicted RNA-binding protein YlqC (UPF0109 family)
MKDLLQFITSQIASHPEAIQIREEKDNVSRQTNLYLQVHAEDMGRIIGKRGRIIRGIRHLVRLAAINQDRRVNLELIEPETKG